MPENLANTSTILLFGRVTEDIKIVPGAGAGGGLQHSGPSHFLADQIAAANSLLARIYAFGYEGGYYELARPALFLVHDAGKPVTGTVEFSGLAATALEFASDLRVWAYDKADLSVRLDVETGTLEELLLETELSPEAVQHAGQAARLRFSGQAARLRYSGQAARLKGNRNSDE